MSNALPNEYVNCKHCAGSYGRVLNFSSYHYIANKTILIRYCDVECRSAVEWRDHEDEHCRMKIRLNSLLENAMRRDGCFEHCTSSLWLETRL